MGFSSQLWVVTVELSLYPHEIIIQSLTSGGAASMESLVPTLPSDFQSNPSTSILLHHNIEFWPRTKLINHYYFGARSRNKCINRGRPSTPTRSTLTSTSSSLLGTFRMSNHLTVINEISNAIALHHRQCDRSNRKSVDLKSRIRILPCTVPLQCPIDP